MHNLSLRDATQNQLWLEIVQLALEPLIWLPMPALTGAARRWEPRRLRLRLFSAATSAGAVGPLNLLEATGRITPLDLRVPEVQLTDLRQRLAHVRLPEQETVTDNSQGVQLAELAGLLQYWRTQYDWRRFERQINALGQYRTQIDGLGIHFRHVRSRHPNATPLLLTHGRPGSFVEFVKAIGPLTGPTAYGGSPQGAFHVVVPSLPGFGFSDPTPPPPPPACTGRTTAPPG